MKTLEQIKKELGNEKAERFDVNSVSLKNGEYDYITNTTSFDNIEDAYEMYKECASTNKGYELMAVYSECSENTLESDYYYER